MTITAVATPDDLPAWQEPGYDVTLYGDPQPDGTVICDGTRAWYLGDVYRTEIPDPTDGLKHRVWFDPTDTISPFGMRWRAANHGLPQATRMRFPGSRDHHSLIAKTLGEKGHATSREKRTKQIVAQREAEVSAISSAVAKVKDTTTSLEQIGDESAQVGRTAVLTAQALLEAGGADAKSVREWMEVAKLSLQVRSISAAQLIVNEGVPDSVGGVEIPADMRRDLRRTLDFLKRKMAEKAGGDG